MTEPEAAQADRLSTFRHLDILLGINQACSEAAHQLRVLHLYQLRKDRKTFHQQLAGLAVFLIVLVPSLSPLIQVSTLKLVWYLAVGAALLSYLWAAKDKLLNKDVTDEYEDVNYAVSLVQSDKKRLLQDKIYSYCNRHDILYNMAYYADDEHRPRILNVMDTYQEVFDRAKRSLLDLRDSGALKPKEYEALVSYIEVCENRTTKLKSEGA